MNDYEYLKAIFLKIYDNLPLGERINVIVFLGEEAISWKLARNYVIHNPLRGKEILEKLKKLEII